VRGRHTIKIGADWQQVTLYANSTLQARPAFTFNGIFTQNPQSATGAGNSFADFLLGLPSNSVVSTRSISESRQHIVQGYVQDDFRISPALTLNLGVRYELPLPFYETRDHYANLITDDPGIYGQVLDASQAGRYGYPRSFSKPDYNNLAPRIGFAWTARPRTIVRSAFGMFYGRDENLPIARRPTNVIPYFVQKSYPSDGITPLIQLSQGFPPDALDVSSVVYPDVNSFLKNAPTPYVLQWNVNVQQELGRDLVLQIGYVGSGGRRLYYPLNINLPTPGAGAINPRRPIAGYGAAYVWGPFVNSNYNGLLVQLERRFSNGLSFLGAYTWSHSIDSTGANQDADVSPQNPRNLAAERGNSNFDVRQRVSLSGTYELPFGHGRPLLANSKIGNLFAGGWEVSGIAVFQTGIPFTPVLSSDLTNTGTTAKPDRVGRGVLPSDQRSPLHWFDTSAFVSPARYVYGNSGRNILRGPGQRNIDLSLSRTFRLLERSSLQFRAEAFNLFNTPQFGLPNATIGTAAAGQITSVVTPERQLQFALRLTF
jgi:hypothetical protein